MYGTLLRAVFLLRNSTSAVGIGGAATTGAAGAAAADGVHQRDKLIIIYQRSLVIDIHCYRIVVIVAPAPVAPAAISVH